MVNIWNAYQNMSDKFLLLIVEAILEAIINTFCAFDYIGRVIYDQYQKLCCEYTIFLMGGKSIMTAYSIIEDYNFNKKYLKYAYDIIKESKISELDYKSIVQIYNERNVKEKIEAIYKIIKCNTGFRECDKVHDSLFEFYKTAPNEIKQILDIAASSDSLNQIEISYNPNSNHLGDYIIHGEYRLPLYKEISISGYDRLSNEFWSVFVHEMSHYAVDMIWRNIANPYSNDEQKYIYSNATKDINKMCSDRDILAKSKYLSKICWLYQENEYDKEFIANYYQTTSLNIVDDGNIFSGMYDFHHNHLL